MSKQKYEQEIEDILRKYDEEKGKSGRSTGEQTGNTTPVQRAPIDFRAAQARRTSYPRTPQRGGFTLPDWKRLSAAQYIGLAVGAAVLAVLIGRSIPIITGVLVILSAILFFVPFVLYRNSGSSPGGGSSTEQKRWRGQPIDYSPRRDDDDDDKGSSWSRRR